MMMMMIIIFFYHIVGEKNNGNSLKNDYRIIRIMINIICNGKTMPY